MDYDNLVRDFAQRTRHNLDRIRQLENQNQPVFAVTQLINSLLGLLVFPRQEFLNRIPATPVSELEANGCPVPVVDPGFETPPHLRKLAGYLRHAVAHFHIEPIANEDGEIEGFSFWNINNHGHIDWKASMNINDIDKFVSLFW